MLLKKINYHFLKVKDFLLFRVDSSEIMQLVLCNVLFHLMYGVIHKRRRVGSFLAVFDTGRSLSEALLFAEHGENMLCKKNCSECQKQFLYTTYSPQVRAWNFLVLNL